ncbi:MAG TPA: HEAT repeat domain-containing protein, partial [Ktedonobacteraceae bacterium]|nr:HEAT repeat domain-containing protein [Ktedonobacteraceae bacterium]
MKQPAIPLAVLQTQLTDPDSRVRVQAIKSIMRQRAGGQAFVALLALLKDPVHQVVKASIKALGTLGDQHSIPALTEVAQRHRLISCRYLALQAVVKIDPAQALPTVRAALQDHEYDIRVVAIELVSQQSHHAFPASPLLIGLLDDENVSIRQHAVHALGKLGDPRAVGRLIMELHDQSSPVRLAVVTS